MSLRVAARAGARGEYTKTTCFRGMSDGLSDTQLPGLQLKQARIGTPSTSGGTMKRPEII